MALAVGQTFNPNKQFSTGSAPGQKQYQAGMVSTKIKGVRNVGGQTYYDIDQTGAGGGTGWALASDVESSFAPPSPQPGGQVAGASAPSASPAPRLDFITSLFGKAKEEDAAYQKKSQEARDSLINYYKNLEDPTARYGRLRNENNLPAQEELVNGLTQQVMQTEDTINNLEGSVNERVKDFVMTDSDRQTLLARERLPHQKVYSDLLRSKQYEEIGLAGKQSLVKDLLALSFQSDERGARPYQLGVDFTEKDRQIARELMSDFMGKASSAFNSDQDSIDTDRRTAEDRSWKEMMDTKDFNQQMALQNLSSKNSLSNSLTLKAADKADTKKEAVTNAAWNNILGDASTESDVWRILDQKTKSGELSKLGVDVDELWSKHAALAGKYGRGGKIRDTEEDILASFANGTK